MAARGTRVIKPIKWGCAALLIALPVAASAQAVSVGQPATSRTPQQGFRLVQRQKFVREIEVTLGLTTTYDSNVARANTNVAQQNGLDPSDVYVAPNALINVSLPFGRSQAYLTGTASYLIHARNSRLDGEQLALSGGVSTEFARCSASLDGELSRVRTNVGNLVAQLASVQNFETTTSVGITVGCGGVVGLQPFGQFDYSRGTNTSALRRGSDFETFTYGGGISYRQPSIGELGIVGSVEDTRYTARDGSTGTLLSGLQSFPTRSVGVYYVRDVTRFFYGKARVNYTDVATVQGASFTGVTGELVVRVSPTEKASFEVTAARVTQPSLSYLVDYTVDNTITASAALQLGPTLSFNARYQYGDTRYVNSRALPAAVALLTNDQRHDLNGEFFYKLGRRLVLTAGAGYSSRRANSAVFEYDAARVFFGVRGVF